ncbi:(2Fe-2S) ferredoxin domain-containing protein [Methylosinus sp. Ce-a6]|uniref:(2Fe-2S) ferredoxin domain-containing protein n=1 Tax=Methylosinus sp. Ce-a6 TaxID=2172005 RepID=UPI001356CCE2|nr:(2Fe-2S) ferredoxin domain-containing protein [Methylosinus sp. Ce-a6]
MIEPPLIRFVVCVGDVCDREGSGSVLHERLSEALDVDFGKGIAAGEIACVRRSCLRHCSQGVPMLRIEPSGEVYADPDIDLMLDLVEEALAG